MNTSTSKKNATLFYIAMCSFFAVVIFLLFKITLFSIIFEISVISTFLGLFIFMYYNEELNKKYHFKTSFAYTYQSEALCTLSLSTSAIGVFLFCTILLNIELYKAILYMAIYLLPFLGIGLRFKTFNNESRWIEDKEVIGYRPFYYFLSAFYVTYIGYYTIVHSSSMTNSLIMFIITILSYLWIIFPDKVNKYLPFENKKTLGFIIYLGVILILFSILIHQFTTIPIVQLIESN